MKPFRAPLRRCLPLCAVSWMLFSTVHAADLPLTRLDGLSLPAFSPGQETEVTITGTDLEGVDTAWFSHSGITAKLVKDKVFALKFDPSLPEGVYDMRVLGNNGVSNPRALVVDRLKSIPKAGECSLAKPMELHVGEAVHGSVAAAGRDFYRFSAQKAQRLILRCSTRELDSRLAPVFTLLTDTGRKLRSNERSSFLEFEAPESGNYLVSVQDVAFSGGADHFYRLSLEESPVLESIAPSVVASGKKSRIRVFGRGLEGAKPAGIRSADGRELEYVEVDVEPKPDAGADGILAVAGAGIETWSYRIRSAKGVSNALPLVLAKDDMPVTAVFPGATEGPLAVQLPSCVSGLIRGGFAGVPIEFQARKGEVIQAEVVSHRLGETGVIPYLRLVKGDAFLSEAYAPETNVGGPRLSTLHNDPSLRFECKEDGKYTLHLSDLSARSRSGPGARYTLRLTREQPGFSLLAATEPPPETANDRIVQPRGCVLRSGGTAALRIVALRTGAFNGEIELTVENLPPGVTASPARIPAGKNETHLILKAQPDTARALASLRIVGRSGDGKIERDARWSTARWQVADFTLNPHEPRLARGAGVLLATTPNAAPLSLAPEGNPTVEVQQGAKAEVLVRVTRSADFKDAIKIKTAGFPGAETLKEVDADAKTGIARISLDTAALKLPPGNHVAYFTVQSKAKVAGRDVVTTAFSPTLPIAVQAAGKTPPPKTETPSQPAGGTR